MHFYVEPKLIHLLSFVPFLCCSFTLFKHNCAKLSIKLIVFILNQGPMFEPSNRVDGNNKILQKIGNGQQVIIGPYLPFIDSFEFSPPFCNFFLRLGSLCSGTAGNFVKRDNDFQIRPGSKLLRS